MEPEASSIYDKFVNVLIGGYPALIGAIIYLFHQINKLTREVGKFEGREKATYEVVEKTLERVEKAIKERK